MKVPHLNKVHRALATCKPPHGCIYWIILDLQLFQAFRLDSPPQPPIIEHIRRTPSTPHDPQQQTEAIRNLAPVRGRLGAVQVTEAWADRKSTRLNSSHLGISYAVFCLKKKN